MPFYQEGIHKLWLETKDYYKDLVVFLKTTSERKSRTEMTGSVSNFKTQIAAWINENKSTDIVAKFPTYILNI